MRNEKVYFFFARSPGTSRWKQDGYFEIMPSKKRAEYNMHVHKYIRLLSALMMAAGNAPEKRTFFHQTRDTFRYR